MIVGGRVRVDLGQPFGQMFDQPAHSAPHPSRQTRRGRRPGPVPPHARGAHPAADEQRPEAGDIDAAGIGLDLRQNVLGSIGARTDFMP